ncbi:MAG: serine/threonine-protein kinase [Gemmataceae bacterium]
MNQQPDADAPTLPPCQPGATFDFTPADPNATIAPNTAAPKAETAAIPGYELLGELGRGGMGVVYKARQRSLKRLVALKMVIGGAHSGSESFGRFRAEAEAVAALQHPNIVQVYEVGTAGETPYFSLEYLDGGSLDKKLAGTPLPPREAAELVRTLARAVQHAHDHGIVHRDLKPANVLLSGARSQESGVGNPGSEPTPDTWLLTPKVTDFGLAKQMNSDSGQTRSGAILGTPSYMAPEQAAGDTKTVGPPVDIYALGAILYECLTGRPPFRAPTPLDTVLQVMNEEPVPPTKLQAKTPRDLETVCLKCLHKKPERRYASASELGDDLQRYLDGDPIRARPASWPERVRSWRKRNPRAFRLALGMFFATVAVNSLILKGRHDSERYARKLEAEQKATATARDTAEEAKGRAEAAERVVQADKDAAVARLYATSIDLAYREWNDNNVIRAEQLLNECPPKLRGWEWDFVKGLCRQDVLRLAGHHAAIEQLRIAPDGRTAVSSATDGMCLWDMAAGRETGTLPYSGPIAVSLDGTRLAVNRGGRLLLLGLPDGRTLQSTIIDRALVTALAFAPDGNVHVVTQDGGFYRWTLADNTATRAPKSAAFDWTNQRDYRRPTFSRDAAFVAAGRFAGGTVTVWEFATGATKWEFAGHASHSTQTAFAPDGKHLASAGADGQVILWDLVAGKELRRLKGHGGEVRCVAFSRDGARVASGSEDLTVRLWDATTGDRLLTFRGHTAEVQAVAFAPDGKRLVSAGADRVVRVWDAEETVHRGRGNLILELRSRGLGDRRPAASEGGQTYYGQLNPDVSFALAPDGRSAVTAGPPDVMLWDLRGRRMQRTATVSLADGVAVAFTPDGKTLATVAATPNRPTEVAIRDAADLKVIRRMSGPACARAVAAFSPDGTRLTVGFQPAGEAVRGEVLTWEVATGREAGQLPRLAAGFGLNGIAYTPDGRELVVGGVAGVAVWPAGSAAPRIQFEVPAGSNAVAVSRDGRIATAGADAAVRFWSPADGAAAGTLEGHVGAVASVAFSPDGTRLASCGADMAVKVWDVASGRELLTLRDHRRPATQVGWSGDGSVVASCAADGALRVWEARRTAAAGSGEWPMLFADRFDRGELGPAWDAGRYRWAVESGGAVGTLRETDADGFKYNAAFLQLRAAELPTTFDLRYDVRIETPMATVAILADGRTDQSLRPVLNGRPSNNAPPAGASLLLMAGTSRTTLVGVPRTKFAFAPGRTYRVRLVREPKHLTVEVDGTEVLAERVPEFDAPGLTLQGCFGGVGDRVHFANVELRAPAAAVRERQVRSRVEQLFDQRLLKEAVAEELAADATLDAADRQAVTVALGRLTENVDKLATAVATVVREPDRSRAEYRLALRQAEVASARTPENWKYALALGLARYRVGEHAAAFEQIEKAIAMARHQDGAALPGPYAALALAARRR